MTDDGAARRDGPTYTNGAEQLADALAKRDAKRYPFPADLFEAAGIRLGVQYAPLKQGDPIQARRVVVLMLEEVFPGPVGGCGYPGRNLALFDTVRWWAYAQDRGAELERWIGRVRACTLHNNQRFP